MPPYSTPAYPNSAKPAFVSVRYMVEAEVSPGLLSRLLQPFAKRDISPDRMWSSRSGDTVHAEIAVEQLEPDLLHRIEGNLNQVVGVISVVAVLPRSLAVAAE